MNAQWHHILHTFGYVILVEHAFLGSMCRFSDYFHSYSELSKGISGIILCLIYTGFQFDKASFHSRRSFTDADILMQIFGDHTRDIRCANLSSTNLFLNGLSIESSSSSFD
ncbi:hypothetical protein RIF29_28430 [Crotalaria pallida]|uniref:Uncharacterized protein n=1 Tax=Crotalaria pallida TaxID=3830 RepID=A0AAN9ED32_CROPI